MPRLFGGLIGPHADGRSRDARLPTGIALFVGFTATFAAVVPWSVARRRLSVTGAVVVMAAVVAAVSWWALPGCAAGIGGMGWLMLNGFAVNKYGDLRWDGSRDGIRLGVLLVAAVTAACTHGVLLRIGHRRRIRRAPAIPPPRPSADHDGRRP